MFQFQFGFSKLLFFSYVSKSQLPQSSSTKMVQSVMEKHTLSMPDWSLLPEELLHMICEMLVRIRLSLSFLPITPRESEDNMALPYRFQCSVKVELLFIVLNFQNLPKSFVRANGLETRCGDIVLMNEKVPMDSRLEISSLSNSSKEEEHCFYVSLPPTENPKKMRAQKLKK
ncbi:unnamed protein product [Brassica napus]|uniref:(rape) hypothetical protein n=1 Tax=Brassica napus TaxID=3708 RepID=A0A816VT26_BRANA|nr:unnamed protein product [Brassica napus]